jgi:hypothetical protein
MKKFLYLSVILAFVFSSAFAQTKFGLSAGLAVSNGIFKDKEENEKETYDPITGLNVGVFAAVPIGKQFSFNPGINFIQKGSKNSESYESLGGQTINIEACAKANCLELQLPVLYNTNGANGNFFVGVGPTFTYALNGRSKLNITNEQPENRKIEFGNTEKDDMRPLDVGANVLAGFAMKNGLFFSANYNLGLANLLPGEDAKDFSMKFNYYSFKIGWIIGNKD